MNYLFMGKCGSIQAFLPVTSLNETIDGQDLDDPVEVIDCVADPRSESEANTYPVENVVAARAFVAALPSRLRDIAYRVYWLDQSRGEVAADLGVSPTAVSHALARISSLGRTHFDLT